MSNGDSFKRIASIEVIKPGSDPDVDSDFNTQIRSEVIEYVADKYGHVANIITFATMKAKKAFKSLCTIYEIPYAEANKISALIPDGAEGVEPTMADIYDPYSDFYHDAADFRNATTGDEWNDLIEGSIAIEGRIDAIGVHPCGVVISAKPLEDVVPSHVRQSDGLKISQWTYPELESIGLIKMDFLGLDTVDLIQHAIENIQSLGKEAPSMPELIHGPMDDEATYELLGRGDTTGIFQLSGDGMRELLRLMKPNTFMDIVACNALFRPGPMGMGSHTKYALRKNGLEKVDYPVHPDFKGSELEDILRDTHFLVVYQEQIIKIANKIAGMTLQEGDDLRKAMGKKKKDVMESMRPVFFDGARKNGFSDEAIQELWDTIATFAEYGFNLSHSVAYAMNGYQSAWLKTNYPKEFMAALIDQRVGDKAKTLAHLQEARRMGLRVGPISANNSGVKVSPNADGAPDFDIVYGFSGLAGVSEDSAKIIVDERNANGDFTSPEDFIKRCFKAGLTKKNVYESIAYAGGFDEFGKTRKAVIEAIPKVIVSAKNTGAKGVSLFDMMNNAGGASVNVRYSKEEFDYGEKLRLEADTIGLYISGHPMDHIPKSDLGKIGAVPLETMLAYKGKAQQFRIVAVPTGILKKTSRRGGKGVLLTLEDPSVTVEARLDKKVIKAIDKKVAQEKFKELYCKGSTELQEFYKLAVDTEVDYARDDIEKNRLYVFDVLFRPAWKEGTTAGITVLDFHELSLTNDGKLPVRVRFRTVEKNGESRKLPKAKIFEALSTVEKNMEKKFASTGNEAHKPDIPILIARYTSRLTRTVENKKAFDKAFAISLEDGGAAELLKTVVKVEGPKKKGKGPAKGSGKELFEGSSTKVAAAGKKAEVRNDLRVWPPKGTTETVEEVVKQSDLLGYNRALNNLKYVDSGKKSSKMLSIAMKVLEGYGVTSEEIDSGYAIVEES